MRMRDRFRLDFPQSLAQFQEYEEAQKAIDFLAAKDFPVEHLMIVGTDLRLVERITGRRTLAKVLRRGAFSGIGTGLLIGLMMMIFFGGDNPSVMLLLGLGVGIVTGVVTAGLGFSMGKGKREFDSLRDTIATTFELLVEHKVAERARELLASMPGFGAGRFW